MNKWMRSYVCHQMRLYVSAEFVTELASLARFQQSKLEFLSEEHSCPNIDSCLNADPILV